jgi:hypothetical protein
MRRACYALLFLFPFSIFLFPASRAAERPRELLVDQVRKAIERGVQYLRDQEKGTGNWDNIDKASVGMQGGWTSLAMLALLNAGVKPDDPIIERSLKYLRTVEPSKTYVVALQTMVFAETGHTEDRLRIQRNVDWLINAMVKENGKCVGWTYEDTPRPPDNSNTQYALLGLHAGRVAGAKIPREVWELIRDYYVRTQQPDHGWIYNPTFNNSTTLTMTTAGLCGLLISGMELNAGREVLRPDGTADNCGVYVENQPAAQALGWVARNFRPYHQGDRWLDLPYNNYYSLYGIERAGRLSGQRFFGEHDWYRTGCEYLVAKQKTTQGDDYGSWHEGRARDAWPVISTSFALLFLSKGRTPVLISKLVHGPGDDWNNDRNDARHLAEYGSRELFRRQPMAWQIFDVRRVEVQNEQDLLGLVGELLPSPVVYFNGHAAPEFTGVETKLLKQYIEQGGFVLAEACCGRKEFDTGFRRLMHELFPDNPLRPLSPDHPIWRAHALVPPDAFPLEGIEYGCKTVVVYSPKDLSCLWEANAYQEGRGQLAFRLAGNILAYATGMEPPKPRLTPVDVVPEDAEGKQIPRGYLKVAQLRHEGDWQPAPNAMRNLMAHLRRQARLDVTLETRPIYGTDPDLADYRFLYVHGRGSFTLSPQALKNLRYDLETGGLLFGDACCGKKAFDDSFREMMGKLFPDKKLEPIPPGDELFGKELNGETITTVRCRMQPPGEGGAELRDTPPQLEGIRIGNRWAVIYSKYDIGCALEKHQSTECLGYDHDSALRLGSAAVLYALMR